MPLKNSRILTHILTYGYPGLVVGAALSGGIVSPLATALFASAVILLLLIFAIKIVLIAFYILMIALHDILTYIVTAI